MFAQRIVVTGLGAVTPIGNDVGEFWDALVRGRSGVGPVTSFAVDSARPSYAAEVKGFTPERGGLPRKKLKVMGRHAQLAFAAVQEACADARLSGDTTVLNRARLGVILGVGMLNADVTELGRAFHAAAHVSSSDGFDAVAFSRACAAQMFPLWLLRHIPNLAAAHASIAIDAQGPSNTIATGCVAAANAIGEAARLIARGEADVLLAGGADARVSPLAMLRYRELGWLAKREDVVPAAVSAPFDESASGFVTGEGAGVLVLESRAHAERRGARIYAELVGYAAATDGDDPLAMDPQARALGRAIAACLRRSGVRTDEVGAVFSPAPSIRGRDAAIAAALQATFAGRDVMPPITATRSVLGHTHGAAAALDAIAAVKAIESSSIPPTINLRHPIADLPFVKDAPRAAPMSTALVGACGFWGHAAALAFSRYPA